MSEQKAQLHLKVVTPTRVAVDIACDEVTLPGAFGALGILPGHTPLLTQLRIGEL
jgi:F-type H+-transporting ATPase subunit epsilon